MASSRSQVNQYRQQALQKQREEEAKTNILQKFVANSRALADANSREDTYDIRRRQYEIEQIAHEQAMETMTRTAALEARRRERERVQEEALALELERNKRDEESRRREIARICSEDPGLRELQSKLQMAYIAKERGEQLKEKEILEVQNKAMEAALHAAAEAAAAAAAEQQRKREEEEKKRGEERRRTLEAQLEEKQLKIFLESEQEAARERNMVEAILAKIAQEDEAEARAKAKAREEVVRTIEEFKAQRERAVEAARQAEREEQRRIADYLASQGKREEAAKAAKAEDAALREAQYRAIVAEQEALRKKQEEEEALRWILVEEEAERRRMEEERLRKEKEIKSKKEMMEANDQQKVLREKIAAEERAKEEKLIAQFLAKCIEDDRKQEIARKAREEARLRYLAEVNAQREHKTALYEAQKLEEMRLLEEARRRDDFKRRIIEEARRKLLEEHATKLRGFLPRGVITSNADIELLKAFDRNKDGKLDEAEMELAQAAFRAYDPMAAMVSAANAVASSATGKNALNALHTNNNSTTSRPPVQQQPKSILVNNNASNQPPANRNRLNNTSSSVSFGGDAWDDPAARTRK